jgi:hypothetical protein
MPEPASPLDRIIPPEVSRDRFHRAIARVAATPGVRQILEIGSSSGAGSTEAFVLGALRNPVRPTLHCLEISRPRFEALVARWKGHDFVRCYHLSSVPLEAFPSEEEVARFWREVRSKLRNNRLEKVLGWLRQDLDYLRRHGLSAHGIRRVKEEAGIDLFDAVLIDGSEFTGKAELAEVYGARFLLLDDTRSYKNLENHRRLLADPAYRLVEKSFWLRNGFSIFERRG